MGNMVVIAVVNSMADKWKDLPFSGILGRHNDLEMQVGKHWCQDNAPKMRYGNGYADLASKGVLVSGAHHASDNAHILISGQMMKHLPIYVSERLTGKSLVSELAKDSFSGIGALMSSDNKAGEDIICNQKEELSFFGYLTDNCSRIPDDIMGLAADTICSKLRIYESSEYCRDQLSDDNGFVINNRHLVYLGNIGPEHAAIIRMSGNNFYASAINNFDIDVSIDMKENDYYREIYQNI